MFDISIRSFAVVLIIYLKITFIESQRAFAEVHKKIKMPTANLIVISCNLRELDCFRNVYLIFR